MRSGLIHVAILTLVTLVFSLATCEVIHNWRENKSLSAIGEIT